MKRDTITRAFATTFVIANIVMAGVLCKPLLAQNNADAHSASTKAELKEVPPGSGAPKFAGLSATIKLDKTQSHQQSGIKMLITLTNEGKTHVIIKNPLEFMTIFLLDKEGRGIKLPPTLSRYLFDSGRDGHEEANKIQIPFHLFLMTLNGRQLDAKEINNYSFNLAAGDTLDIGAELDRIMKETSPADSQQSEIIRIPPGDYQTKVAMHLFGDDNSLAGKHLESEFIKVQLVDKETTK